MGTAGQRDETRVRQFVENYSAMFASFGLPRMAARVLVALLVDEQDALTAAELADRLGVSPAAISHALKYLTSVFIVTREAVPNSRRDRYRITDHSWFTASFVKAGRLQALADEAEGAIDAVGGPDSSAGHRLTELRDFYRFMSEELSGMVDRWQAREADAASVTPSPKRQSP